MAQLIKIYAYTSGIAETKTLPGGRFFRLLKATAPVDVEFFAESGDSLGKAEQILAGLALSIEPSDIGKQSRLIGFARVKITSATAQNIQAAISRQRVEYDRSSGSVDGTIVKQLWPWEGRNPLAIQRVWTANFSITPHASTTRITYTVPANKIFILQSAYCRQQRQSAAGTLGVTTAWIGEALATAILRNTMVDNAVGAKSNLVSMPNYHYPAGSIVIGQTGDTGLTGTMAYDLGFTGIEFDV